MAEQQRGGGAAGGAAAPSESKIGSKFDQKSRSPASTDVASTVDHLEALPVAEQQRSGGAPRRPLPHLCHEAEGRLRWQEGVHRKDVSALPHLLRHNARPPPPQHRVHAWSTWNSKFQDVRGSRAEGRKHMHQRGLFCKSARGAITCLQHLAALWQGLGLKQRMQCLLRKHCMYKRPAEGNASAHPTAPQTRRTPRTGTWPPRGGGWPPRPLAETPAAPLPSPAPHAHDVTHTLSSSCAGGARTAAPRTSGG